MRFNLTVVLTLVFLATMLGAGTASAWLGYTLGSAALKGVSQPDINPAKKLTSNNEDGKQQQEPIVVSEKQILTKVYNFINAKDGKGQTRSEGLNSAESTGSSSQKDWIALKDRDEGVTLQVVKASQQEGSLLLEINLKNDSARPVRFLYSFLDVRDERNQALSAVTDGLPEELPANGENFSGTVRIAMSSLEDTNKISLILTDYPDQKLELEITDIPVMR